ncbi:MAG: hypothetical protein IN808_03380 [Rubrobacter sp.]|nr:hypothetical protein [Rubrobacter sp.]
MAEFDSRWMNAWQDVVNNDATLSLIGRYFTTDFLIGFGEKEYRVSVREGRIERITDNLSIETPWSFALRAPRESWERFAQKVPPPMYNDVWAMAHPLHGRLKMDGDVKVMWQNIRALTWMLARMREVPDHAVVEERATRV